jgi:hypothetical protein
VSQSTVRYNVGVGFENKYSNYMFLLPPCIEELN